MIIDDYGIFGLRSILISRTEKVTHRVFHMRRHQHGDITPHSHRFHLNSTVLQGYVENTLYVTQGGRTEDYDWWNRKIQTYQGTPGKYTFEPATSEQYRAVTTRYKAGESYFMQAHEIHSIRFSKDAIVIIEEIKPEKELMTSTILLPRNVLGIAYDTMQSGSLMFNTQ